MITYPIVSFGKNGLAMKADATFSLSTGTLQPFSDLNDLGTGEIINNDVAYATLEPNYWVLDGSYHIVPTGTSAHVGMFTETLSDAVTRVYDPDPELLIVFGSDHSIDSWKLYFSEHTNDYPDSISIFFNDANNNLIYSNSYVPTSGSIAITHTVANFRRMRVRIFRSNKARRFARLTRIDFDSVTEFTGEDIRDCKLVEQINPLSVELPVNTLDLTLFSSSGDFSIVAPTGTYANLQYKEPLDVHEVIGNLKLYMGRFYLDEWESQSENLATFKASDAIAMLTPDYLPQIFPAPTQPVDPLDISTVYSQYLIADIMLQAGMNYELDSSLNNIVIKGWLPVVSCREALQQVLFRIGAYATCSHSGKIQIKPIELASSLSSYDFTLTSADKGLQSPVLLRKLVTGVEVTSHDYSAESIAVYQLINFTTVTPSTFILKFNRPITGVSSVAGATVNRYGSSWYELVDTVAGACSFDGKSYNDTKKVEGLYASLPTGTPSNILQITNATLVDVSVVPTVVQRVYNYYQQRYIQRTRLYASQMHVGDSVLIDTQSNSQIKGIVEKMNTDLAGGMISDIEILGVIA